MADHTDPKSAGESISESVRADLTARVAALGFRAPNARPRDLASDVAAIRTLAHRNGFHPAVTVAQYLDFALSRGERGPLLHGWLSVLRDAVAHDRQDAGACDAFAAACAVRIAH